MRDVRILMVCLGNICRSPLAEGILREKIEKKGLNIFVDSAGTGAWHAGEAPDHRAIKTAKKQEVDISQLRARQFELNDFDSFDKIYVMDSSNLKDILSMARNKNDENKVMLLLKASGNKEVKDVPDPWYGGMEGFEEVFRLLDGACERIAESLLTEVTTLKERK